MRAKLNEEQKSDFKRLDATGYTLTQLSERFGISTSTAERYRNEKYRELGRQIQRRKNKREQTCYKCSGLLSNHPHCPVCEILVHGQTYCSEDHEAVDKLALTK